MPGGVLSDKEIIRRLKDDLIIHPMLDESTQVKECKVDLHLSGVFYEILRSSVDSYDPLATTAGNDFRKEILIPLGQYLVLHPGDLILASTFENVNIPTNLLGILEGRSSLGRLGVIVHATASFIDPGFKGAITLELSNLGHLPVRLYTLARVAALAFFNINGEVTQVYGAGRQGHAHPKSEASRHHEDWEYIVIKQCRDEHS